MNRAFKNIEDFKAKVNDDHDLQTAFKTDPMNTINSISEVIPTDDKWVYRIVVSALGSSILLIIIGVVVLMVVKGANAEVPAILTALGSAAIGAMAGLLAPSPRKNN